MTSETIEVIQANQVKHHLQLILCACTFYAIYTWNLDRLKFR